MKTTLVASVVALVLIVACAPAWAAKTSTPRTVSGAIAAKPVGTEVEMFAGIKSGDIEVTLIPKDATEATLLFKNNLDKPVAIQLPEAFAGVPVLAQFGGMGGMGGGMGGMGGMGMGGMGGGMGGGMQGMMGGMGGGMGGMGGGMGGMGMGGMGMGGFMNVEPDKIVKIKVPCVCLEHGKKDPAPRAKYEIRPLESFTKSVEVAEIGKMLGRRQIDQKSAQAAVWHVQSGLSWEQLANKDKIRLSSGYSEKFFSPREVTFASQIVLEASRRAKEQPAKTPPKSSSLSQN